MTHTVQYEECFNLWMALNQLTRTPLRLATPASQWK